MKERHIKEILHGSAYIRALCLGLVKNKSKFIWAHTVLSTDKTGLCLPGWIAGQRSHLYVSSEENLILRYWGTDTQLFLQTCYHHRYASNLQRQQQQMGTTNRIAVKINRSWYFLQFQWTNTNCTPTGHLNSKWGSWTRFGLCRRIKKWSRKNE